MTDGVTDGRIPVSADSTDRADAAGRMIRSVDKIFPDQVTIPQPHVHSVVGASTTGTSWATADVDACGVLVTTCRGAVTAVATEVIEFTKAICMSLAEGGTTIEFGRIVEMDVAADVVTDLFVGKASGRTKPHERIGMTPELAVPLTMYPSAMDRIASLGVKNSQYLIANI